MTEWSSLAPALARGDHLTYEQSRELMRMIMSGSLDEVRLSAFLSVLAVRGVEIVELQGLADEMQSIAEPINVPREVVDIVGTGGDSANTVNISTMAALVIAGVGFPVVKHGNRASTSACGSADVLEALGVNLELNPSQIAEVFNETGMAFLFANKFHPSMRHAARVRRELGFPTVFNVLGPLTNPARPTASVVGVARPDAAPLVAGVFAERGTSAFVFRGAEIGLDELSTVEPSVVWDIRNSEVTERMIDPAEIIGVPHANLDDLRGGSPSENAEVAHSVMAGDSGPISDAVALNAAMGVLAASPLQENVSFEDALRGAYERTTEALRNGTALQKLNTWVEATNNV